MGRLFDIRHPYFLCLLCLVFVSSCQLGNEDGSIFYTYNRDGDLWRVPLIYPYEAISPTNGFSSGEDWFLELDSAQIFAEDYTSYSSVKQFSGFTRVGIMDSVIVLDMERMHWPLLSANVPSCLIVDVKTDSAFLFSLEHQLSSFQEKQDQLEITAIEMLDWVTVKDSFIEDLTLPKTWPSN